MSRTAAERLFERVEADRAADPLRPVTVVVPNHYAGLWLRRELARSSCANVRFLVLAQLAEALGAPALAGAGRSPLSTTVQEAAIGEAVRRSGADFGAAGEHPSLAPTLRSLFSELGRRELDAATLPAETRMATAALAAFDAYRALLRAQGLYEERDLLDAATAEVLAGRAARLLDDFGPVHLHVLPEPCPAELRFLDALADHAPVRWLALETEESRPAEVRLAVAPDAVEEVRCAARRVAADLEAGVSLHRTAIVYRLAEPYAALVRETLDAAGLPWAGLDGRPVSDSRAGRALLGLLRLPDRDFSRPDVIAVLGALSPSARRGVSVGQWDRLSRQAGIVRGARQWSDRLGWLAETARRSIEGEERSGGSEARLDHLRRQVSAGERMSAAIEDLERETRLPHDGGWDVLAGHALRLRRSVAAAGRDWPAREREAAQMVDEVVAQLGTASAVQERVPARAFLSALAASLEARRQPEGRFGLGVVVGPVSLLAGMAFERVHVVGATERAFPPPLPPDPFFPIEDGADPLDRRRLHVERERRGWTAALAAAAGGTCRLSFPAWDDDLRPQYPSPWLVELASGLEGRPVTAGSLREGLSRPWIERVPSPEAGLRQAPAAVNVAERRARLAGAAPSLRRSALALRAELPLGRHLEVRDARAASAFTEFDGNLAAAAGGVERLSRGLSGEPVSPTSIEDWAACPFRYLLGRVLRVEATERPEQDVAWALDSLTRGALVHEVLRRFFVEAAASGRPRALEPWTAADRARMEAIAESEFARLEERGRTGYRLAWENERDAILADLRLFVGRDTELRGQGGVPAWLEQGFGMPEPGSWPAAALALSDGREVRLRGRIDRVDLAPDRDHPRSALVLDYKTGKPFAQHELDADPLVAGTKAQLAAYTLALEARYPGLRDVAAAYWYVTSRGGFSQATVRGGARDRLAEVLRVVDRGVRAGAFPQVPGEEDRSSWANCAYCAFDRVCPTGRDLLWDRKRADPAAAIHADLSPGSGR